MYLSSRDGDIQAEERSGSVLRVDSNPKPASRDFTKHIDTTKGKVSWE